MKKMAYGEHAIVMGRRIDDAIPIWWHDEVVAMFQDKGY